MAKEMEIGDSVYCEGRKPKTNPQGKVFAANGVVTFITYDDDGEVEEVVVKYGEGDADCIHIDQLNWYDEFGGQWRVE